MSLPSLDVRTLRVAARPGAPEGYPVHVATGGLGRLGDWCRETAPADRYAVIADATVAELYGETVVARLEGAGLRAEVLAFPPGEASKSRATWADLTDRMLEAGFGRDAAVVALGGGVTGDLAAFTASTYMRGVPVVVVPTSLLAMLDSSVGGKTALDTPAAKNAVGTFHHPRLVVIDPKLLDTLPARHLRAGLAEAVKIAAVRDAELFASIEADAPELGAGEPAALCRVIEASVRLKADVVSADPDERGVREVLNFGHTAGHALEAVSEYQLLHGEAIATGMQIEARLGETIGVTVPGTANRLDAILASLGLPRLEMPVTASLLLERAASDKKARGGAIRWVLLEAVGRVARGEDGRWSRTLDPECAERWLDAALRGAADVRDSAS